MAEPGEHVIEDDLLDDILSDDNRSINEIVDSSEVTRKYLDSTYKVYLDSSNVDLYYCDIPIESGLVNFEIIDTSNPVFSYDSDTFTMLTGGSNYIQGALLIPIDSTNIDVLFRITLKRIYDIINALYKVPDEYEAQTGLDQESVNEGQGVPHNVLELFASFFIDLLKIKSAENPNDPTFSADVVISKIINFIRDINIYENHPLYVDTVKERLRSSLGVSYRANSFADLVTAAGGDIAGTAALGLTSELNPFKKKYVTIKYLGYKRIMKELDQIMTEMYNLFMSYMDLDGAIGNINYSAGADEALTNTLYKSYISGIYDRFTLDVVYRQRFSPKGEGELTRTSDGASDRFEDSEVIRKDRVKYQMVDTFTGVKFNKVGMQQMPDGKAIMHSYNFIAQNNIYDEPRSYADYDSILKLLIGQKPKPNFNEQSIVEQAVSLLIEFTREYSNDHNYLLTQFDDESEG